MRCVSAVVLCLVLTGASVADGWAQIRIRPGQYEQTIEIDEPGASGPAKRTELDCITPDQAKDVGGYVTQELASELPADGECRPPNTETTGTTMIVEIACSLDGTRLASRTEMTFGADWFTSVMRMTIDGQVSTWRGRAKWIAETCIE